jgi:lipooligosaccharide transport system permease protein
MTRPLWLRVLGAFMFRYRRTWFGTVARGFVFPALYLAALGSGLGGLVDSHLRASAGLHVLGNVSYLVFVTPGLLAGAAMQVTMAEATYPVLGMTKFDGTFEAMLTSPVRVGDIVAGHLGYIAMRSGLTSATFLAVAAAYGALPSAQSALAVFVGILLGLAFGAPTVAYAITQRNGIGFAVVDRLVIVPLFLFSGSFFPVTELPGFLRVIAELTPLYHGVALARACTLGRIVTLANAGHLAYLLALASLGTVIAVRTYRLRLEP